MIQFTLQKTLSMEDGRAMLSVEVEISSGEFVVLFGESGAGKTSLLRMISGLMTPEQGTITCDGEQWLDMENRIDIPVQEREIGFVFQRPALFPNMTVEKNILYAAGKNRDKDYLQHLLQMTGMEALHGQKPDILSGGQQQRVAIIRALARKPRLLLLDEPFSSLNIAMRQHLRHELKMIHDKFNLTTLLVSHDIADIYGMADRVLEMNAGKIVKSWQSGQEIDSCRAEGSNRYRGKVTRVLNNEMGTIVEVSTNDTLLKIPIASSNADSFQPGAPVRVIVEKSGLKIHSLAQ